MRRAILLIVLMSAGACAEPFLPRASVSTLDDPGSDGFASVVAGRLHTCAIDMEGAAYCWGSNEHGQLGVPADSVTCRLAGRDTPCQTRPRAVSGPLRFLQLSAGRAHTCGLTTEGRLFCWGDNEFGQLGEPSVRRSDVPVAVATGSLFTDLAAGGAHTCAVRSDGAAQCWGSNAMGQLGRGSFTAGATAPVTVATNLRFEAVAAGEQRSCARATNGGTYCWGETWLRRNDNGVEVTRAVPGPEPVGPESAGPSLRSIAVGRSSCGIDEDNVAFCWEANPTGTMGDGTTVGSTTPRQVVRTAEYVAISAGGSHTCAIADTGLAYCWGSNRFGQLGISPSLLERRCVDGSSCALAPTAVSGWRQFAGITAGLGDHACGVTLSGNVYCWGAGSQGQRGDGRRTAGEWSPARTRSPPSPM